MTDEYRLFHETLDLFARMTHELSRFKGYVLGLTPASPTTMTPAHVIQLLRDVGPEYPTAWAMMLTRFPELDDTRIVGETLRAPGQSFSIGPIPFYPDSGRGCGAAELELVPDPDPTIEMRRDKIPGVPSTESSTGVSEDLDRR